VRADRAVAVVVVPVYPVSVMMHRKGQWLQNVGESVHRAAVGLFYSEVCGNEGLFSRSWFYGWHEDVGVVHGHAVVVVCVCVRGGE
jgi:hypothetical protein